MSRPATVQSESTTKEALPRYCTRARAGVVEDKKKKKKKNRLAILERFGAADVRVVNGCISGDVVPSGAVIN